MASNLSENLRNYLQKSAHSSSRNGEESEPMLDTAGAKASAWFNNLVGRGNSGGAEGNGEVLDETANGWFSQAKEDPCLPSLSKKQRIVGFVGCIVMGVFCFALASMYVPFIVLKARKFSLLYTLGSVFIIGSFSLLWGPYNHLSHLLTRERLPFTTCYFGSMFATLYFALWVKSTVFTVIFAVIQILSLVWYVVSYIPGGNTGLKFFTKVFYMAASKTAKTAANTLPV